MQYVIIAVVVVAIALGLGMFFWKKKIEKEEITKNEIVISNSGDIVAGTSETVNELTIQIEQLPIEMFLDDSSLVEVKDEKVLARIDSLVPGLGQAGVAAANAVQAAGDTVYRAIIPAGAKLTDSKAMEGAVRGIYHGADGIKGHANLVAVEKTGTAVANTAAAAMGVASMIVGQYYMTQINAELSEISDGLEKISSFQDNEYKSKVFALVAQVKKISAFQGEILENDTLRKSELDHLNKLEDQCLELLGQANLTVADFAKKKELDYEAYEKEVRDAQNWYVYQQTLLEVMNKISELKYALNMGDVSREQCTALLPTYIKQAADSLAILADWHNGNVSRLAIDTSENKRKRQGFDGVIHWLPGLFDDTFNYASVADNVVEMIGVQSTEVNHEARLNKSELYGQDVQLISKNGKIYYLPTEELKVQNV